MTLNARLNIPAINGAAERVQAAQKAKKAATETMEEAWERILAMKNSDADNERLREVQRAMAAGKIGREPSDVGKRFSKAEALRMWRVLNEQQRDSKIRELVEKTPGNYVLVDTWDKLRDMVRVIKEADLIALDCETFGDTPDGGLDPWSGKMAGFSISTRSLSYYVPLNHVEDTQLMTEIGDAAIVELCKDALEGAKTVMHNAPFDCKWFWIKYAINLWDGLHADTRIMAMAFDENRDHRLKNLITDWLKIKSDNFDELFDKTPFNQISLDVALPYAAGDTEKTLALYDWIHQFYDKRADLAEIKSLVFDIEMPVCRRFIRSDLIGIGFDAEKAGEIDRKLETEESALQSEIFALLGEEINLNSPIQLKKKLFVDLKLTDLENGSTGVKVLKRIKNEHPVIGKLLEYREVGKLRQAFTQKLPREIKYDGRIHPWHNTFGAATGRFTCSSPNTQQIPAKRPEIRQLFTAAPDKIFASIDYSQIELRVLAHMAKEEALIQAFHNGQDIHSTTAAMISDGKYTYEQIEADKDTDGSAQQKYRKQAKIVNFGIVYGMSDKGLSDTLGITRNEAKTIIENYFKGYPGIQRFMDEQKAAARKQGYVTDMFGRKRRLHEEYKSKDRFLQFRADRQAGNYPIQASAGSILKKAIVDLAPVLAETGSEIILQVHDELVFECPATITREELYRIKETMEQAVQMLVPVRCDLEINPRRWAEKVSEAEWFENKSK